MILEEFFEGRPSKLINCDHCGGDTRALIRLDGYGDGQDGNCNWCYRCAQNALKELTKDLRKVERGEWV
jgi:hypothetical protein